MTKYYLPVRLRRDQILNTMRLQQLFLIFSFQLLSLFSFAQLESNLLLHDSLWLSNRLNPAITNHSKLVVGLTSTNFNFQSSSLAINDFIAENEAGEKVFSLTNALEDLEADNLLRFRYQWEWLSLGVNFKRLNLNFHAGLKSDTYVDYSESLAEVIALGNAPFIGQTVSLQHDVQSMTYSELGIGVAYKLNPWLQLGAKVKLLSGLRNISTESNVLSLYTDPEIYELSLNADYQLYSSNLLQYNGLSDFENVINFDNSNQFALFSANTGTAFDFGLQFHWNDWRVNASVLDIGSINWEEDVNNYTLQDTYEFDGLDIFQDLLTDSVAFDGLSDTLETVFRVQASNETYATTLPTRFYLSVSKSLLNNKWTLGAAIYGERYRDEFFSALTLQAQYQLLQSLSVGASYSTYSNTFDHLGLNAVFRFKGIQIFALTNNVLTVIDPLNNQNFDFRLGASIDLGKP